MYEIYIPKTEIIFLVPLARSPKLSQKHRNVKTRNIANTNGRRSEIQPADFQFHSLWKNNCSNNCTAFNLQSLFTFFLLLSRHFYSRETRTFRDNRLPSDFTINTPGVPQTSVKQHPTVRHTSLSPSIDIIRFVNWSLEFQTGASLHILRLQVCKHFFFPLHWLHTSVLLHFMALIMLVMWLSRCNIPQNSIPIFFPIFLPYSTYKPTAAP